MDVTGTIRDYYAALEDGEALYPFFREDPATVKFGISEALVGYEAVAAGLREQTRTTTDWVAESRDLTVGTAWFADDVFLAWTDTDRGIRYEFDTRWSGSLVDGEFAAVHVSVATEL
ncbi:MAG: hypothetical protein ABEH56_00505 [Salinirussus sp.]